MATGWRRMAKGWRRGRRISGSRQRRASPYGFPSVNESMDSNVNDSDEMVVNKDWEDVTCSVCMEYPHNAILLLCSSYDIGCRPYMCGTSFRYSNCFDQYMKHTKVTLSSWNMDKSEAAKLQCPLCRGQVKGWTVLEPAREYLNTKRRNCTHENCSFVGTFKELRKHVKANHPSARPHRVDPVLEQKWRRLEQDQARNDVISTIRSSMPGAVIVGDYVIERNNDGLGSNEVNRVDINADVNNIGLLSNSFDSSGDIASNRDTSRHERDTNRALNGSRVGVNRDSDEVFHDNGGVSLVNRLRRQGRVVLGRSERRRLHREDNRHTRDLFLQDRHITRDSVLL